MENNGSRLRQEQIENIARVIVQALESRERRQRPQNRFLRGLELLTRHWVAFLFVLSLLSALVGWVKYDIALFQPLEELAAKQKQYRRAAQKIEYQRRMVKRHVDLGNSFLSVSQLEAAKNEFEMALDLDPHNKEADLGLLKANIFTPIDKNDYSPEVARKKLNFVLKERPDDPHVLTFLGDVHLQISRDQSLQYYERAIEADPTVASAYFGKAVVFDMNGQREEATRFYRKAMKRSQWNQTYRNNLGYQYYQNGDFEQATQQYQKLLQLDFRYLIWYYNLSAALRVKGDLGRAAWYHKQLIKHLSNDDVTGMRRNKAMWFWHTDSGPIRFYDYPMKKCYAFYSAALTVYLQGRRDVAQSYVDDAQNTDSPREGLVQKLMRHDLAVLRAEHPSYAHMLDSFAEEHL